MNIPISVLQNVASGGEVYDDEDDGWGREEDDGFSTAISGPGSEDNNSIYFGGEFHFLQCITFHAIMAKIVLTFPGNHVGRSREEIGDNANNMKNLETSWQSSGNDGEASGGGEQQLCHGNGSWDGGEQKFSSVGWGTDSRNL
jgi:hypothetical protein